MTLDTAANGRSADGSSLEDDTSSDAKRVCVLRGMESNRRHGCNAPVSSTTGACLSMGELRWLVT